VEQPNSARYTFLDPRAPQFLRDWDKAADDTVAILRAEAGRDPYDRNLSDQGQNLLIYVAEPHSPAHDALNLLASYAATHHQHGADKTPSASRGLSTDRSD
jgi:hypothetical protein